MAIPTGARGLSAALILLLHHNRRRTNPRVTVGTDRRRNLLRDRESQPTVPEERAGVLPTDLLPMEAEEAGVTGVMEVIPPVMTRGRTIMVILGHEVEVAANHPNPKVRLGAVEGQEAPVAAPMDLLRRHHLPLLQGAVAPGVMVPRATGHST